MSDITICEITDAITGEVWTLLRDDGDDLLLVHAFDDGEPQSQIPITTQILAVLAQRASGGVPIHDPAQRVIPFHQPAVDLRRVWGEA